MKMNVKSDAAVILTSKFYVTYTMAPDFYRPSMYLLFKI